jgi:cardiolipin synthase
MTSVAPSQGEGDLGRIVTVPNLLSLARLGLVAGFSVLALQWRADVAAAVLLGAAGATDFLDGYVARRFGQVTTLGKVLDPTVDRLVLATAIAVIVAIGAVPAWLAAIVLAREAIVAGFALVLAGLGARRIDVTRLGKAGTFGLMWCFPLFLWGHARGEVARVFHMLAWIGVVPSLALSLGAAVAYLPRARAALSEGRLARAGAARPC